MPQKLFDASVLIGLKYGRLTIIGIMPPKRDSSNNRIVMVKCICDCGNETITRYRSMKYNQTFSCGCYHKDSVSKSSTKHGLSNHKLYKVWANMKDRCFNEKNTEYHNYGERGITVCKEWLDDFVSYYYWCINNGWEVGLQIDRIDNNGNYEPSNCRLVKPKINNRNTRGNRKITINGVTKIMIEWCEFSGIGAKTLQRRLVLNWPEDKLLSPINIKNRKKSYKEKEQII